MSKHYKAFIEKLAFDYFTLSKLKEFPYKIRTETSPLLQFENAADLELDS